MDSKQRYKELKKENDNAISYLSDSYQKIALIFTKKARNYGVKNLDTEVRIKNVVEELTNFDLKGIETTIAIPNISEYIESNIKKVSKAPSKSVSIKEIIAVTLFIGAIVAYFAFDMFLNKKTEFESPSNVNVYVLPKDNRFYITWDHNAYAENGYSVKVYENGVEIKNIDVAMMIDKETKLQYYYSDIKYNENSTYVFEIYVYETDEYKQSDIASITYPN